MSYRVVLLTGSPYEEYDAACTDPTPVSGDTPRPAGYAGSCGRHSRTATAPPYLSGKYENRLPVYLVRRTAV
jgi:hypothetical protein